MHVRSRLASVFFLLAASTAYSSIATQTQLAGIKGVSLRVQVIDLAGSGLQRLEPDLQAIGATVLRQQHLGFEGGPHQDFFVTVVITKVSVEHCADVFVVRIDAEYTDDLQFKRDPALQSPKGFITWRSNTAHGMSRAALSGFLKRAVNNTVADFVGAIPDHAFVEPDQECPACDD